MSAPRPISELAPEDRFDAYVERSTNYFAAIEAAGDKPWWQDSEKLSALERAGTTGTASEGDVERRRALFMRRFTRPAPPGGLFVNPAEIRGHAA
ncbi:hypothetical protein K1X22_01255 [Mycolicibacterium farcinogenes]|uniref:hypothetical protein n=1 Tax=Mycolicibacterium farcinogenes TaxID=1802 RepID=UPI001C8E2037|nr:hypothetical protein [Mycolicibacterium farcinogenes]QZH60488.1 hypothetical protein K1X22_01255 [Mycolicibacterium farcinogenes]